MQQLVSLILLALSLFCISGDVSVHALNRISSNSSEVSNVDGLLEVKENLDEESVSALPRKLFQKGGKKGGGKKEGGGKEKAVKGKSETKGEKKGEKKGKTETKNGEGTEGKGTTKKWKIKER